MTTAPKPDQFRLDERRAEHLPTGAVIAFPMPQPWTSNGFSLCEVGLGEAEQELPTGEHYRIRDIIDEARRLMLERALA